MVTFLPEIQAERRSVLQNPQTNPDRSAKKRNSATGSDSMGMHRDVVHGDSPQQSNTDALRTGKKRDSISEGLSGYACKVNARMDKFMDGCGPSRYTMAFNASELFDEEVDINRFDEIVKQIDELNGIGNNQIITLTHGHEIQDFCMKNRSKTYKMALKAKPEQVTVEVVNIGYKESSGTPAGSITIYGSVVNERPSRRSFQYQGSTSIQHVHAFLSPVPGEDGYPIDRRKVAPLHRWLYISVEAAWGDCKYRISGSNGPVKIQMTKTELKSLTAQTRASTDVEKHIDRIKNDPIELEQLEERCKGHLKKRHGEKNVVEENKDVEKKQNPKAKYIQNVIKRVKQCQREDQVVQRHMDQLNAKVERAEEWVTGPQRRAEKRAEEARQKQIVEDHKQRIRMWQVFLTLHASASLAAKRLKEKKQELAQFRVMNGSSNRIQKMYLHSMYARRRVVVYSNVTRFRMGLVTYIRQSRLQTFISAGICLGHHLRAMKGNPDESSEDVLAAIRRFKWATLSVQRKWQCLQMIRDARVDVYSSAFRDFERTSHANSEPVPDEVMEHVLTGLVKQQQGQWLDAKKAHQSRDRNVVDDNAAAAFLTTEGGAQLELAAPRTTAFLLQKNQLAKVVETTHERFKAGEFEKLRLRAVNRSWKKDRSRGSTKEENNPNSKSPQRLSAPGSNRNSRRPSLSDIKDNLIS